MQRDIIIVGGGVIGLMSAYFLYKSGRKVTIIDEGTIENSTSFGNAGLLSAFDKSPLSHPGIVFETLKLILKGESPVQFHPRLDLNLYKWLVNFILNSNEKRQKKTMILFEKYGELALDLYKQMMLDDALDFDLHEDGLLMIYTEQKSFDEKIVDCQDKKRFEILNPEQTKKYMPCANEKIKGSVLLKRNAHLDPKKVMLSTKKYLQEVGVEFILNEKIIDIKFENNRVKEVNSLTSSYEADTFILSTGYQTLLSDKIKTNLMMTPAKGYSITFKMPDELKPKMSSLFADMFIAMTPRCDDVRITSKLELGSTNPEVVKKQIDSIKKNFKEYTIPFEMKEEVQWTGFRPLTPNDIPLIGRDEKYKNLIYATGLGWLGITFAPAIGYIMNDL
ncbi:MAG: FAD-binding oxidoreductase, partial [Arcobacter sp.]|nr:FAD-binding oxidoreductase [Arcobacter sp.]